MPRVIRACLPVAGSTSQSRAASSASVPSRATLTRATGAPTRVTGLGDGQVHAATPGSVVVPITRQPAVVPGRPPPATGSVSIASGPGTGAGLFSTVAGPGALSRSSPVASAENAAA